MTGEFTTAPRFGVWAPVYGNHGARAHPDDPPDASYRRNRDLLVRAEEAGYDATLVAQHVVHPSNVDDDVLETWSTLAALAEATSRIELIGAIKPVLLNPLVFAKIAGNIADIAAGRLSINVVSGWFLPELEALGVDLLDHDDRYAYTRTWLEAVTALWSGKTVPAGTGPGQPAIARPVPQTVPPVYVGGESELARALAADHADVFFINGRPLEATAEVIGDLRARPRSGAPLRFGLSAFVVARDTEAEALAELDRLQALVDAERRPEISWGTDPKTQMYKVLSGTSRVGSNGGTLAGLVGSYDQVSRRIGAFHDAGIELFMLQFQPLEAELERFAEHVIPRFRGRGDPMSISALPVVPVGQRLERLDAIVEDLRHEDAAAERDRVLQYDAVERLRQAGVLGLRVPVRYGGPGASVRDVLTAVIRIACGSSNVAQALRPHFGFSERLLSNRATEAERREWFPKIATGLVVGNAITDARGVALGSADTTVLADADGVLRLNGYKFYSTGTLYADVIAVSAVDAAGRDLQAIIAVDREGVELLDDWDGFGQRTTASGGTRFTDVIVEPVEVTTISDGRHLGHSTTFLQLYLAAVAAGIAAAVRSDAVDYVRQRARPAAHSLADTAAADPFVLQAVGEISAAAAAAQALVLMAADQIDALVDGCWIADPDAVAQVAVVVAEAQLVAERLTLTAAQRLFDTGGASATARSLNLDRHWRNARTLATHSPLDYKAHAAGDFAVNGATPPANGYF